MGLLQWLGELYALPATLNYLRKTDRQHALDLAVVVEVQKVQSELVTKPCWRTLSPLTDSECDDVRRHLSEARHGGPPLERQSSAGIEWVPVESLGKVEAAPSLVIPQTHYQIGLGPLEVELELPVGVKLYKPDGNIPAIAGPTPYLVVIADPEFEDAYAWVVNYYQGIDRSVTESAKHARWLACRLCRCDNVQVAVNICAVLNAQPSK